MVGRAAASAIHHHIRHDAHIPLAGDLLQLDVRVPVVRFLRRPMSQPIINPMSTKCLLQLL
jgi:hypothetical protein